MLKKLNESDKLNLKDSLLQGIVEKIDYCIRFFLQVIYSSIKNLMLVDEKLTDSEIIEATYQKIIEGKQFNTWIERIKEQYGKLEKPAFIILKHISKDKKGIKRKNLLQQMNKSMRDKDPQLAEETLTMVLRLLINDGYLMKNDKLYLFRSPLIRDFWFNRFVK